MSISGFFYEIGRYSLFIRSVFRRPEKWSIYYHRFIDECISLGINSLGIVSIMSLFIGAVITLQTSYNIDSPFIPLYTVGFTTRQSIVLEFSPTIISLILAGIVGSNISSEIGSMRVTEQIDALDIMGVNSAGYLVLPKILGAMFMFPFVIIISMFLGLIGGWLFGVVMAGEITGETYRYGIQYWFDPYSIKYALTKTTVFAYIITSIASYYGYHTSGGSVEVGRSSTRAVVVSSIFILLANYLLTQWLLL
jgi:phospholipid/cholesterol/gamma-HCH transport system permease protein